MRRLALLLSAPFAVAGCLALPIPTTQTKVLAGSPITDAQLAFIEPGRTTRQDVVDHLGNPGVIWDDARVFAYDWDLRQGILLWAAGAYVTGSAGAQDIPKHHLLLIEFDAQDRVTRVERAQRPLTQSYANFLRQWRGRVDEAAAGTNKAIVVVRIECTVDGEPQEAFVEPTFTKETMFAIGLGSFDTIGEPRAVPSKFFSRQSRRAGWTYLELAPGIHYVAVVGPDTGVVAAFSSGGIKQMMRAAPRWRIDVPDGVPLIYAGTLTFAGTRTGTLLFGGAIISSRWDVEPALRDESDLARDLLARQRPDAGEPQTRLLRRWQPGDQIYIGMPARASVP